MEINLTTSAKLTFGLSKTKILFVKNLIPPNQILGILSRIADPSSLKTNDKIRSV